MQVNAIFAPKTELPVNAPRQTVPLRGSGDFRFDRARGRALLLTKQKAAAWAASSSLAEKLLASLVLPMGIAL